MYLYMVGPSIRKGEEVSSMAAANYVNVNATTATTFFGFPVQVKGEDLQ